MKIKIIIFFISIIAILGISTYASGKVVDSGKCGDNVTWTLYDDGTLEISGTGDMYDYKRGETTGWKKYDEQQKIKRLKINEGVTSIGNWAFAHCENIKGDLFFPESLKKIGDKCFVRCYGFDGKIKFGSKLEFIGEDTFYYCNNLTGDLFIPDSVTHISLGAFNRCEKLDGQLHISNKLTVINHGVFGYCAKLSGIVKMPDSIQTIEGSAFSNCSSITGIIFSKNLKSIGTQAFSGCKGLSGTLVIPEGVTNLDFPREIHSDGYPEWSGGCFIACSNVTEVYLPTTIKYIGSDTFHLCNNIKSIYFYGNVPTIEREFFGESLLGVEKSKLTVYYPEGASGWTTPTWNGYKTVPLKTMPSINQIQTQSFSQTGQKAGDYYSTDIKTTVNGAQIDAFNIGGQTVISAEDLAEHGFSVKWNGEKRTLEVTYVGGEISGSKPQSSSGLPVGTDIGDYYFTDIITYLDSKEITSYNVGGRTYILAEEMVDFGYKVVWDGNAKTLTITVQ